MDTSFICKTLIYFSFIYMTLSCVQDDEYTVPEIEIVPIDIDQDEIMSISILSGVFEQALTTEANNLSIDINDETAMNALRQSYKLTIFNSTNYVEGYVISSDAAGNFFEELIVQDNFEFPVAGMKILIDSSPLFSSYQLGRKIYLKLEGLTVGYHGGVFSIGLRNGYAIEKIAESLRSDYLLRDTIVATILPLEVSIIDFSRTKTNLFVRLSDVQFSRYEVIGDHPKTFAAEPFDEFDGERILEECANGFSTVLSTSTFADFKTQLLPNGRGTLDGILTMNYFGEVFNVVVNDPSRIDFETTNRCDPLEIDCGISANTGTTVLFSDFFETQNQNDPISGNGWTNFIEEGTITWEAFFSDSGNVSLSISAHIGSYNSGDNRSIGWLVTPQINFDAQEGETLNFKTSNSFADGSRLELMFSNDWDGMTENIRSATWNLISSGYIVQNDDNFSVWYPSGNIDLSCLGGIGYIAWKYIGNGNPAFDGTYELDEIEIKSQ